MEEQTKRTKKENFNPLRKEIVEVRFIPSDSKMYSDPATPVYGGLAENASITFAVPSKNGMLMQILTADEQAFFEKLFGLTEGAMSTAKYTENYWKTYNKGFINRVTLDKTIRRLDLSNPKDYIEWKILCANDEVVCPNYERLQNNQGLNTYRFVMSNENAVSQNAGKIADLKLENFEYYSKYKDDDNMLRVIIYLITHKKVSPNTKIELLKRDLVDLMENKPIDCNKILSAKNLEQKKVVLISTEKGLISERNGFYYLTENGKKLSEDYEDSNLDNAANYLANVANQELYFSLMKKVK